MLIFFFQAEDGIRDKLVTGVQTCALPICREAHAPRPRLKLSETWWRHALGIFAAVCALFPVWFLCSAAFSSDDSVSGTTFLPQHPTLRNFSQIVKNHVPDRSYTGYVESHFL